MMLNYDSVALTFKHEMAIRININEYNGIIYMYTFPNFHGYQS